MELGHNKRKHGFQRNSDKTLYLTTSTSTETVVKERLFTENSSPFESWSDSSSKRYCQTNERPVAPDTKRQSTSRKETERTLPSSSNSFETPLPDQRRFKSVQGRAPFSRETPYFSKDTPIIVATAKYVGSEIQTSCNSEFISRLQNTYSECVSSTSSEYFRKLTPMNQLSSRSRSVNTTQTDSGNMNDSDVHPVRNTSISDGSSANDSQVVFVF